MKTAHQTQMAIRSRQAAFENARKHGVSGYYAPVESGDAIHSHYPGNSFIRIADFLRLSFNFLATGFKPEFRPG